MKVPNAFVKLTIGEKFGTLLAVFLALQILQLGAGLHQVRHVSEEGGHLGAVGSLRPASLAELARRLLVSGSNRPVLQQQLLDALAAQDRIYRRLNEAYKPKSADPEYADIARSVIEARDVWQTELRPLIRSVDPTQPGAARAALARYEALFPAQAGRLARIAGLIEQHLRQEILVSLRNHAAIFALSMLLALVAAWVVRRHVALPLRALAKASQAIAGGAYDQRLPVASHDEIGRLAHAMREMAATLHMRDVEFAHAFDALRHSREMLERIFENTQFHIAYLDRDFNFIRVNKAYADICGHPAEFFVGKNHFALYPGAEVEAIFRKVVETGEPYTVYARPFEFPDHPERGTTWWDWTLSPVRHAAGKVAALIFALVHVTERVKAEQRAGYLHLHDELTGLPNRALLVDRLGQAVPEAGRRGHKVAVLGLDLDRFKFINESLGHDTGDAFIQAVARRLLECVRPGDTVARLEGDEFAVVFADVAQTDDVYRVIHRIKERFVAPVAIDGHSLFVTLSIGVTLYPLDGDNPAGLLKNAEAAMHDAKKNGGDTYRFYSAQMTAASAERLALENDLRRALEQREFLLYYQPQVDLKRGHVTGAEALIRWRHPVRGMVSPAQFIPLAEETGLIVPIGEWVLREACRQAHAWQRETPGIFRIAVNLSPQQFKEPGLGETVRRILGETGLDPRLLDIELTESVLAGGHDTVAGVLGELERLGIRISIDDFGTGYSSLSHLKRFPVDMLKIDRSFVRDVTTDPDDAGIVVTIIGMAHALGIQTVAEGVETKEQLEFLRRNGCDAMQGYYFSRPVPADDVSRMLREKAALLAL